MQRDWGIRAESVGQPLATSGDAAPTSAAIPLNRDKPASATGPDGRWIEAERRRSGPPQPAWASSGGDAFPMFGVASIVALSPLKWMVTVTANGVR